MPELAFVNGAFLPIHDAKVSIEDRGFQFGDGVYEVIVVYDGKPFLLDRHLSRLRRSAAGIGLEYDFDAQPIAPLIDEGVRRAELRDAMVYIQLTRGAAPRSHVIPPKISPTVVMTFKALPLIADDVRARGLKIMTTLDNRWADCHIKAITLLPNVLAKNAALARGFDDAIFVTKEGQVRECTSSNVFMVKGGALIMPPRDHSILHGVTQGFLMECAAEIAVPVEEERFHIDSMRAAEEVFLCSTLTEVLGIVQIDAAVISDGHVGKTTQRLFTEFRRRSRK